MVFLEVWRRRARVRFVNGSLRPWLLVTATNLARNASRARRRYEALLARLPHGEIAGDVADQVVDDMTAHEDVARLGAALAGLRKAESEAIALCDLAEMSYADAAAALNISIGTLKSRLSRGRARLRAALDDDDEHGRQPESERWLRVAASTPGGKP